MAIELFLSLWDSVCSGRMLGTDRDGGAELGVPVLCLLVHRLLPGGSLCVLPFTRVPRLCLPGK